MKQYSFLICFSCFLLFFAACDTTNSPKKEKATQNTPVNNKPSNYVSPLDEVKQVLLECVKVEYLLYDYGISFESEGQRSVGQFFAYIVDSPADESKCPKGQHDGAVVFKNADGDIKLSMEINIFKGCNRLVFTINDKRHALLLNDQGIGFFNQVLQMRSNPQGG